MELSIVIPVYNSFSILNELVNQIDQSLDLSFELILVNDCSPDNSWAKISQLSDEFKFIKGINLRKNSSQHNALMAGLNYSKGKVIIMMDDDLQHDPKYINKLCKKIQDGYDACYTKFPVKKHSPWKKLGSQFNGLLANLLLDKPKELYLSPFKAISREIKEDIIKYDGPYPYVDGLILAATNSIAVIEVEHKDRFFGDGNYTFRSSLSLWLKMVTGFSMQPLRISTYAGFIISFFSFMLGGYYIFQKILSDSSPDGWTSLMVMILFFGGIQLLSIGIIGEYIGRTHLKLNQKAQFIIKEIK
jgi:polyisoprenyl-phosphate glycosyltransferase